MFGRLEPKQVFTPRSADVNAQMYVSRPELEKRFKRAVDGTHHIIVFGDSGSGKTWLYKKYFAENKINYKIVDLSIAITRPLDEAFRAALPREDWEVVSKSENSTLGTNFGIVAPSEGRTTEFRASPTDPFVQLLGALKAKSEQSSFIVFDNFEQVSRDGKVVKELASLILRLDNSEFAKFGVRFLFVGVVADMKELIARFDQAGTVGNRLTEVPEVKPLTENEANELMDRGFVNKLKLKVTDRADVYNRVRFVTCRNAQQLHELCYYISCEARDAKSEVTPQLAEVAEKEWIGASLSLHVAQIEARMNKRDTKIQRRNQVLYCIGASDEDSYRASTIEDMVRKLFPGKAQVKALGVDQILAGLAAGDNPLLIRNPNDSNYRLAHPKLRLAMRVRLEYFAEQPKPKGAERKLDLLELTKLVKEITESPSSSSRS